MKSRDLAAAAGGAALAVVVVVTVYEGKQRLMRENGSVMPGAGQAENVDSHGAQSIEQRALDRAKQTLLAHQGGTAPTDTRKPERDPQASGASLRKVEDLEREKQDLQAQLGCWSRSSLGGRPLVRAQSGTWIRMIGRRWRRRGMSSSGFPV